MNRNHSRRARIRQAQRRSRAMMLVFVAVLVAGLFVQVSMMSRLSRQAKASQQVEKEIQELGATADNLNLSLNQYRSPERVALLAERLGMEQPTVDQIRVVNLPAIAQDTSAQSAENIGTEEMQ